MGNRAPSRALTPPLANYSPQNRHDLLVAGGPRPGERRRGREIARKRGIGSVPKQKPDRCLVPLPGGPRQGCASVLVVQGVQMAGARGVGERAPPT